jgi:hypothetical protein
MPTLGHILLAAGLLVALIGQAMFLAVAFRRSLWWFFGCLFLPFVDLVFLILNWRAAARPFGIALLGLLVAGLGAGIAGIEWPD